MRLTIRVGATVALVSLSLAAWDPASYAASPGCAGGSPWQGNCSVSNDGSQVDVGGTAHHPGTGGGNGSGGSGSGGGGSRGSDSGDAPGSGTGGEASADEECPDIGCRGGYSVILYPDVTIDDLASFVPARPTLGGEPAGFGVVGMPTNLVATASTHSLTGPLLGWDVSVRFRPVGFVFDYGDGTTVRTTTGGTTWAALGLPQFSPTATSHVYRERGTYTVRLTLQYAADVDFGSGWRPVSGYVNAPAPPYPLEVLDVRTALVERTCTENPGGPGC